MNEQTDNDGQPLLEPDLSGRLLGDYLLLRRLGRGGMADVYLAEQQSLKRQVAVKTLKQEFSNNQSYIRRFHNEAQAAAALVQPNIVQIFEVGKLEGVHYIAQEYVRGQNLKQLLQRNGALDPFLAINIMRQVATALQKAGEAGIVHRDIKPENIMISNTGEVKVADFGLARLAGDPKATDLTQIGITMGTPLYMSPEQIEGRGVDQRSDIYSLGVTCYQMLAGRPPFDAETALAVAVQHLKQEPPQLSTLRPDLPKDLCRVVHRMMNKEAEDRYQSGAELLRDLLAIDIDTSEANWSATFEKLSLSEAQALYSKSRLQATRKLDRIIKGRPGAHAYWGWIVAAGIILTAFAVGWAIPQMYPPAYALDHVAPTFQIAKKENARKQYHHAYFVNTEEAWLAVSEYFPPDTPTNRYYGNLALVRLGGYYLEPGHEDLSKAEEVYSKLQRLDRNVEEKFRWIGLAGQVIVRSRNKDDRFSRENLTDVLEHANVLDRELLEEIRSIQQRLDTKSKS